MQKPNKVKGMTLVELILGMLILTISLGGFYLGIMSMAKYLFEPEKILQAINVVEFYQNKIKHLKLPRDCQTSSSLKELTEVMCQRQTHPITLRLSPEEVPWARDQRLEFTIDVDGLEPRVYVVKTTLLEDKNILFSSIQWKVVP